MKDSIPTAAVLDENLWPETAQKLEAARFLAISLVIWQHTLVDWPQWSAAGSMPHLLELFFTQIGRQGTVIFFFISGFFLSKRLAEDTVWGYLRRRWETIIRPWMIFVIVCVVTQVLQYYLFHHPRIDISEWVKLSLTFLNGALFFAGYWFVTMSVFSGAVLVSLRRYRHHIGLGVILLAFLVAYNVNLYLEWFTSNHSKAFMGYVFYIWLGVQFAFHLKKVLSWINSIPKIIVFILVVISTALSGLEGAYLKSIGSEDPFGSIRITNGIASMLLLVLFLRTIEGRRTRIVFGMYLIHIIVLVLLTPLSVMIISKFRLYQTVASMVTVQVTWFALIMVITYYLTKWMGKSSWRWVIGGIKPASASRT